MWNIPYEGRLKALGLHSLATRRIFADLCMCYKIVNGLISTNLADLFTIKADCVTRDHNFKLQALRFSKDITKYNFVNRSIRNWNLLPARVVHVQSLCAFKKQLYSLSCDEIDKFSHIY